MQQQQKHVLLVEDNRIMADMLRRNLQHAGMNATIARSGVEGCEACRTGRFDAIVTDYQMPKMDGLEFVTQLRQSDLNADAPVIFLTGKGLEIDTVKLRRELGIREVLFKPFSPRILIGVIESCFAEPEKEQSPSQTVES